MLLRAFQIAHGSKARFKEQVSMRKRRNVFIPATKLHFWFSNKVLPENLLSKFGFCLDGFFKHYSAQILLKVPKVTERQSRIKQQLTIFFSFDIWS